MLVCVCMFVLCVCVCVRVCMCVHVHMHVCVQGCFDLLLSSSPGMLSITFTFTPI